MKLGIGLDLFREAVARVPVERVRLAERLGYHSVWTAEAYGADAFAPLAVLATATRRIKLATGVAQVAARAPAATAMAALTLDALAGGSRVIVGLGVSGPGVVEGWYGRPWGSPHDRLRDHVAIMREVIARERPVVYRGRAERVPYEGPGAVGGARPLRSILHPAGRIGIWIAAGGPSNTALAAEIADGWLPMGYGHDGRDVHGPHLARGWERRGGRPDDFEIFGNLTLELTDDVAGAIAAAKPLVATYVGGMGTPTHDFHRDAMARRGWPEAAGRIAELWRAGRRDEAIAAVPDDYVDGTRLIGSADRIRSRWDLVVPAGLTGVVVRTSTFRGIELAAELAGTRDRP